MEWDKEKMKQYMILNNVSKVILRYKGIYLEVEVDMLNNEVTYNVINQRTGQQERYKRIEEAIDRYYKEREGINE